MSITKEKTKTIKEHVFLWLATTLRNAYTFDSLFTYVSPPSWWSFSLYMLEIECVNKLSANGAPGLAIIRDRIIRENHSS